jgi:hypothetical protein
LRYDIWVDALSPDRVISSAYTIRLSLLKTTTLQWDILLEFTLSRRTCVFHMLIPSGSAYPKSLVTSEVPSTPHPNFHM